MSNQGRRLIGGVPVAGIVLVVAVVWGLVLKHSREDVAQTGTGNIAETCLGFFGCGPIPTWWWLSLGTMALALGAMAWMWTHMEELP